MIYHFVKNIELDVKANSLEEALAVVESADKYNSCLEQDISYYTDNSAFEDGSVEYMDISVKDAEFVGSTDDSDEDPEESFYDYLTEDIVYSITDKGKDYLDYINGNYPEYDENDYDEHGSRVHKDANSGYVLYSALKRLAGLACWE